VWGADPRFSEAFAEQQDGTLPDIDTIMDTVIPSLRKSEELEKVNGMACYIYLDKNKSINDVFAQAENEEWTPVSKGESDPELNCRVDIQRHMGIFSIAKPDQRKKNGYDAIYNVMEAFVKGPVDLIIVVRKKPMPAALIREEMTDETEA
jgi:hypothetical protein